DIAPPLRAACRQPAPGRRLLTDLAWLLRAYSQSVSSDGAQHGEKTS
ncbi:hypothetical protein, partial [Pseudomonas aeruginosa]